MSLEITVRGKECKGDSGECFVLSGCDLELTGRKGESVWQEYGSQLNKETDWTAL